MKKPKLPKINVNVPNVADVVIVLGLGLTFTGLFIWSVVGGLILSGLGLILFAIVMLGGQPQQ